jgi:hypothetical protein
VAALPCAGGENALKISGVCPDTLHSERFPIFSAILPESLVIRLQAKQLEKSYASHIGGDGDWSGRSNRIGWIDRIDWIDWIDQSDRSDWFGWRHRGETRAERSRDGVRSGGGSGLRQRFDREGGGAFDRGGDRGASSGSAAVGAPALAAGCGGKAGEYAVADRQGKEERAWKYGDWKHRGRKYGRVSAAACGRCGNECFGAGRGRQSSGRAAGR